MKIILVRHVETIGNAGKRYIGWTESEYTEKGKQQIHKVVNYLLDVKVDGIISSPMSRTYMLAKALGNSLNKKIETDDRLKEMNFGIFENKTYEEIEQTHKKEWELWVKDYENYRVPKGESLIDVYSRVTEFIDEIINKGKDCLIVTHGGIIQTIITYLLELDIKHRWHFLTKPGSIVEIKYKDSYGMITRLINLEQ